LEATLNLAAFMYSVNVLYHFTHHHLNQFEPPLGGDLKQFQTSLEYATIQTVNALKWIDALHV
jgi:hypothetical protein